MKPIKLTMQAFGSYGKRCELDFTKPTQNLFLITGDTGAGKTTIFDALVFAVYGEASSNSNRKDGTELQSQFVDYDVTPFVEFVFSKGYGASEEVYVVKRIPRHLRYLKRGNGFTEDSESVSLILPDGSECNQSSKEIDSKLVEIIGLTKEQFMQVAMIAQGEFMELLRTKSDSKKLIFRKLFNTDIFQKIIDEFALRRKKSQTELAKIKTVFQTESRNIQTMYNSEGSEAMAELRDFICSDDRLLAQDMDSLLEMLNSYCAELKLLRDRAETYHNTAYSEWEKRNEAYIKAQPTSLAYDSLDRAEKLLAECNLIDNESREKLTESIFASYDICAEYRRLKEAESGYAETALRLDEYKKILPELVLVQSETEKFEEERAVLDRLISDIREAHSMQKRNRELEDKLNKLRSEYETARRNYQDKNNELNIKRTMYLDSRAGFIAKESLRAGEPCPVCGSLSHPSPCTLSDEHKDITRELIDELSAKADALRTIQESKASEAESAEKLLAQNISTYNSEVDALIEALKDLRGEDIKPNNLAEIIDTAKNIKDEADSRGDELGIRLASILSACGYLGDLARNLSRQYPSSDRIYEKSKTACDSLDTLISECERLLPVYSDNIDKLKSQYISILSKKHMDEAQWQNIVSEYTKADAEKMRADSAVYNNNKASAVSAIETAMASINGSPRPDISSMKEKLDEAKSALDTAKNNLDSIKKIYDNNMRIYNSLYPESEKRRSVMAMHKKLDELYSLLSGNTTGQRMDIETFVQRHYLERILAYANVRFRDMSAGQFELRMYDIAKAGEGKNRGLDLMVYSTVTGKEREVRTLSGGESFMAALSLALGMADRISQDGSALSLDLMFIDEGFGSLDDHSRNQAVKVLKQMADSSKIIGIISHVTELKQEIDNQLIVRKTDQGSTASWQIC